MDMKLHSNDITAKYCFKRSFSSKITKIISDSERKVWNNDSSILKLNETNHFHCPPFSHSRCKSEVRTLLLGIIQQF